MNGWVGCDFDGTLAHYDHWRGIEHLGDPVPAMVARVKVWLAQGKNVRIFTARVWNGGTLQGKRNAETSRELIRAWCRKHIGQELEITNEKDFGMLELWDNRAVQVRTNTGLPVE